MNVRLLLLLVSGSLLLTGCAKSSSIDARKTGTVSHLEEISSLPQLTDRDIFGDELTLDITDEDIRDAVDEAKGPFLVPLGSAVILVQSGSRAPDASMQQAMQQYYQVSTFSGIPVTHKKMPVATVKKTTGDEEQGAVIQQPETYYMEALRYIAAKGRQKMIVVYQDTLEIGRLSPVTKEMNWKKYAGEKLTDGSASLRYLIRFTLVDVTTGEWAAWSPVNVESVVIKQTGTSDTTDQQIMSLKQRTSKIAVSDLMRRYSDKV